MGRLMQLLRGRLSEESERRSDPPSAPARSARVLLVEGEPIARGLIARALREEGCVVLETDGQELARRVQTLAEQAPDLVISDVQSLDPLGLAALADLRRVDWVMPIVLIASDDLAETHKQARRLRASAIFARPVQVSDVQRAISAIVAA
jgi:CheY-like chemotaxis protein